MTEKPSIKAVIKRLIDDTSLDVSQAKAIQEFKRLVEITSTHPIIKSCFSESFAGVVWGRKFLIHRLLNRDGSQHAKQIVGQLKAWPDDNVIYSHGHILHLDKIGVRCLARLTLVKFNAFFCQSNQQDIKWLQFKYGIREYDWLVKHLEPYGKKK